MTDEEIHNIYLHMSGKAEGLVEATGKADFPVLFARAILEYEGMTKDVQNMASKSTYKEQLKTKDEPVAIVISESGANVTHSWWHEPALPIGTKLYTSGWRKRQIEQSEMCSNYGGPCKKEWVGLTDQEYQDILNKHDGQGLILFYHLIEEKLKEKNT